MFTKTDRTIVPGYWHMGEQDEDGLGFCVVLRARERGTTVLDGRILRDPRPPAEFLRMMGAYGWDVVGPDGTFYTWYAFCRKWGKP